MLFYPKTQCCFFDPWIRDGKKSRDRIRDPGSGMNIPELIFENFVSVFGLKYLNSLMRIWSAKLSTLDRGSGMEKIESGTWNRDKHPGSATLLKQFTLSALSILSILLMWSRDGSLSYPSYPPLSLMIGLPVRKPCVTALATLTSLGHHSQWYSRWKS